MSIFTIRNVDANYLQKNYPLELFARAIKIYGKYNIVNKMCEVPVKEWIDSNNTNVKPSYFFRLWYDLYKIRKKYIDNKPS